jgi:hypothetical protein
VTGYAAPWTMPVNRNLKEVAQSTPATSLATEVSLRTGIWNYAGDLRP